MPEPIDFRDLLNGEIRSFRFEGYQHGGLDASFFIIHYLEPGTGPGLHTHPYPEIFITLEGEALMTHGDEQQVVRAGDIVIVPARHAAQIRQPGRCSAEAGGHSHHGQDGAGRAGMSKAPLRLRSGASASTAVSFRRLRSCRP